MRALVVIGTSPFSDTSVVVGPTTRRFVEEIVNDLESKGYVTEVCPVMHTDEVEQVVNDEGRQDF